VALFARLVKALRLQTRGAKFFIFASRGEQARINRAKGCEGGDQYQQDGAAQKSRKDLFIIVGPVANAVILFRLPHEGRETHA
jgi:hypothetical protein